jgi:hypothetical protein
MIAAGGAGAGLRRWRALPVSCALAVSAVLSGCAAQPSRNAAQTGTDMARPVTGVAEPRANGVTGMGDGAHAMGDGALTTADGAHAMADGAHAMADGAQSTVGGAHTTSDGANAAADGASRPKDRQPNANAGEAGAAACTCRAAPTPRPKRKHRRKPRPAPAPPQLATAPAVVETSRGGVVDAKVASMNVPVMTILGRRVQGPTGEDMGRVVDVLTDNSGRVRVAIIDFGGFLGVGARRIAVDWPLLRFIPNGPEPALLLSLSVEKLRAAPEYKDDPRPQILQEPAAAAAADGKK